MEEVKIFVERENRYRVFVKINCAYCGKEFLREKRWAIKNKNNFCCVKHSNLAKQTRENVNCAHCGKEFWMAPARKRKSKSGLFFCSKSCKAKEQRFEGKISQHIKVAPRDFILKKYNYSCANCGYNEYKELLEVHHIDRNRNNNKVENFICLCVMCHTAIHRNVKGIIKKKFRYLMEFVA